MVVHPLGSSSIISATLVGAAISAVPLLQPPRNADGNAAFENKEIIPPNERRRLETSIHDSHRNRFLVADGSKLWEERHSDPPPPPSVLFNVGYRVRRDHPEAMAEQYLRENSGFLGLRTLSAASVEGRELGSELEQGGRLGASSADAPPLADLEVHWTRTGPAGHVVRYRQTHGRVPVYGGEIAVTINRDSDVSFVTNDYNPNIRPVRTIPSIPSEAARQKALKHLGLLPSPANPVHENSRLVIYDQGDTSRLAWELRIVPRGEPMGDWEILVDAHSAEIFKAADRAMYFERANGYGTVFDPDPITAAKARYGDTGFVDGYINETAGRCEKSQIEQDSPQLTAQLKSVNLTDLSYDNTTGTYSLDGPWAGYYDYFEPIEQSDFSQASANFSFTRAEPGFEAVNCYYHIDKMMRYLNDELGLNIVPSYTPFVRFDPHYGPPNASLVCDDDRSGYAPAIKTMFFGMGGVDDAEDPDVIIHELGHAIHDFITGESSSGGYSQWEGLSEGFGDYLAASYKRSLGIWAPEDEAYHWISPWDAHNEFKPGRVTNYNATYANDYMGYGNVGVIGWTLKTGCLEYDFNKGPIDGQIWSTCNMKVWDLLGRTKTDKMVVEGMASTGGQAYQIHAAQSVLQAAANLGYSAADLSTIQETYQGCGYFVSAPCIATCGNDVLECDEVCDGITIDDATCDKLGCNETCVDLSCLDRNITCSPLCDRIEQPTVAPTNEPSVSPTNSKKPSDTLTSSPSSAPTNSWKPSSTRTRTVAPTNEPSVSPTNSKKSSDTPTSSPSSAPANSWKPSSTPTSSPTDSEAVRHLNVAQTISTLEPTSSPSDKPTCDGECPRLTPTNSPSHKPSSPPSVQPSMMPSVAVSLEPSEEPSTSPSLKSSSSPSHQPTKAPSAWPSVTQSQEPSSVPSMTPSDNPTIMLSSTPSSAPSSSQSVQPSVKPSFRPTVEQSQKPSSVPSSTPSDHPTIMLSISPSSAPSSSPSDQPSVKPSFRPSVVLSQDPSSMPSLIPSENPSIMHSASPSSEPSSAPSGQPSAKPSLHPSIEFSQEPSSMHSLSPSNHPSTMHSTSPSVEPSLTPSDQPYMMHSTVPSAELSQEPSGVPSSSPTDHPSIMHSTSPSIKASSSPSGQPSLIHSTVPSIELSQDPSSMPSLSLSDRPSIMRSTSPSAKASSAPSGQPSMLHSTVPSVELSQHPSSMPSSSPSVRPSIMHSTSPSVEASSAPSGQPSLIHSTVPSVELSVKPSGMPSSSPSDRPTIMHSTSPSIKALPVPSGQPSLMHSAMPSVELTVEPTGMPSPSPSHRPSIVRSTSPSVEASSAPSIQSTWVRSTVPSVKLSVKPSGMPSLSPSDPPSIMQSTSPSVEASSAPSSQPSLMHSTVPSVEFSQDPSSTPSSSPSVRPSTDQSRHPSVEASSAPTGHPSLMHSTVPSVELSVKPTNMPSSSPSHRPSITQSTSPSAKASSTPKTPPVIMQSTEPSVALMPEPSSVPSLSPTDGPSIMHSTSPSVEATSAPSDEPTQRKPEVQYATVSIECSALASPIQPAQQACSDGKKPRPTMLTLKYLRRTCDGSNTSQDSKKWSCNDVGSLETSAHIMVVDHSMNLLFEGNVTENESFEVKAAGSNPNNRLLKKRKKKDKSDEAKDGGLGFRVTILVSTSDGEIPLQALTIHTSCSAPLIPGDVFGSIMLIEAISESQESNGRFTSADCNSIFQNVDRECKDVKPPSILEFRYVKEPCQDSFPQGDKKGSCRDQTPLEDTVMIMASDDNEPLVVEPTVVTVNESFSVVSPRGDFSNEIEVFIHSESKGTLLQALTLHTSCSAPLLMLFGSLDNIGIGNAQGARISRSEEVQLKHTIMNPSATELTVDVFLRTLTQPCAGVNTTDVIASNFHVHGGSAEVLIENVFVDVQKSGPVIFSSEAVIPGYESCNLTDGIMFRVGSQPILNAAGCVKGEGEKT